MKWEYWITEFKPYRKWLDEFGDDGWELIAIVPKPITQSDLSDKAIFKRSVEDKADDNVYAGKMKIALPHPIQERARQGEMIIMEVDNE